MDRPDTNSQSLIGTPRILVVDNEVRLLTSLRIILEQQGFNVSTASGGAQACEKLGTETFDVVLLDLLMPDMNGQQVMSYMSDKGISSAIIIISVVTSFAAVSHALRKGVVDYLKKPFDKQDLLNSIQRVLYKKQAERELNNNRKRLHKATQLQRFILNNSPDIVFIIDGRGRFSYINKAVARTLEYKPQRLQGQHFSKVLAFRELTKLKESIAEIKRGNNPGNLEVRIRRNNEAKSIRVFELAVLPIYRDTFRLADNVNRDHSQRDGNFTADASKNLQQHSSGTQQQPEQIIGVFGSARDITERQAAQQSINFQAFHDLLTRLPNRKLFTDRLNIAIAHSRRHKKKLAVLFIDLDRFKLINDSMGHSHGDQILQSVASRLQGCIREGDTLARFGGDEFVLLLPDLRDQQAAGEVAQKIIHSVEEPFILEEKKVHISVSIGIAIFPTSGVNMDQLIQHADIAMYQAKEHGKGAYQFFDQAMLGNISSRQEFAIELRDALRNDEFEVYYQPQLCTGNGSVTGVEALVRWHHPQRGILHPAQFIPMAEETYLLAEISEWVLRTACQQVKQWMDTGYSNIRLAVNMSAAQLEHPELVATIKKILEDYCFPPANLELELTENMIMSDLEPLMGKLQNLSETGITIAIDDFGTGHSTLSWLNKLPIHTLKVDKSFVHDISDSSETCIVNGIVAMAHGLKLNIVAEGVETQGQLNYLKDLGCQQFQGFYFAEAKPAADIISLLDKTLLNSDGERR